MKYPNQKWIQKVAVSEKLRDKILTSIKKLNENSIVQITISDFIRYACEVTSTKILMGEPIEKINFEA